MAGGTICRTELFGRDGNASALDLVQGTVAIWAEGLGCIT